MAEDSSWMSNCLVAMSKENVNFYSGEFSLVKFNETQNHGFLLLTLALTFEKHSTYLLETAHLNNLVSLLMIKNTLSSNHCQLFNLNLKLLPMLSRKTMKIYFSSSAVFCFVSIFKIKPHDVCKINCPWRKKWFLSKSAGFCFRGPCIWALCVLLYWLNVGWKKKELAKCDLGDRSPQTPYLFLIWLHLKGTLSWTWFGSNFQIISAVNA